MIELDDRTLERRVNFWAGAGAGFAAGVMLLPAVGIAVAVLDFFFRIWLVFNG